MLNSLLKLAIISSFLICISQPANATQVNSYGKPTHNIGDLYGGGIVFYVYDGNRHGLIAAPVDQNNGIDVRWHGGAFSNTMALADGLGAGKANTTLIITNQGLGDGAAYAARICNEYSVVGLDKVKYADWYLPSKYELSLMYSHIGQGAIAPFTNVGGFALDDYWSSTENNSKNAWSQSFFDGSQDFDTKDSVFRVRAIRAF